MMPWKEIRAVLPILEEFQRDGHQLRKAGALFVCLCPFHQEKTPSCYVTPDKGRFHCYGCGANGSVIDYHAFRRGITPREAIAELALRLTRAGEPRRAAVSVTAEPRSPTRQPLPRLPELETGSGADFKQLSGKRNVSLEALRLASGRGLLWFSDLPDGPEAIRAWVITDRTRKNAQARRLDGDRWHYDWNPDAKDWLRVDDPDKRRKVRGFTGNQASWPVGIEEAQRFDCIAILEGVDLLAAFHFLVSEGREDMVGPVAILGTGNRIADDALKLFDHKRVRMFPHADANGAGLLAAAKWEAQLLPIAQHVDAFDFTGLVHTGGKPVKDLNDATSIDYDCFEAEQGMWSMMSF